MDMDSTSAASNIKCTDVIDYNCTLNQIQWPEI